MKLKIGCFVVVTIYVCVYFIILSCALILISTIYLQNNQYGRALKQILPVGNYAWLKTATVKTLVDILAKQKSNLKSDPKSRVVDFFACVNIELDQKTCSSADLQREEEFNLLVRNQTPNVFNYTEKMLRVARREYSKIPGKYTSVATHKKLMSGTKPMLCYWAHSSIIDLALKNGWKITNVHNVLTFTAQRICEDYIQFNQDERLRYTNQKQEFLALFHKLMNNGVYGWFCRAVEKYKQTELLFSSQASYEYFEKCSEDLCTKKSLQERATIVMNNPHDNNQDKIQKIEELFGKQISIAEKKINSLTHFKENSLDEHAIEKTEKRIRNLKAYIATAKIACRESISLFKLEQELKSIEIHKRKKKLEADGKKLFEIPKSQLPTEKNKLKPREEVLENSLRGKMNGNTTVVLFNGKEEGFESVCFGMVSSPRKKIVMQSKNDIAVVVLAHAKARIGTFFRLMNDCLPTRFNGLSLKLMMTDTDSVAIQASYLMLLRRNPFTKQIAFKNKEDKESTMSVLGSDKMKAHLETFLSCSPEMCRMTDAAHYKPNTVYFDASRKKEVGLYSDEAPLPKLIKSFQCIGPKNYQFKMIEDIEAEEKSLVSKAKHKGIPQSKNIPEEDYSNLLVTWDKQFDKTRSIKNYSLADRRVAFEELNCKVELDLRKSIDSHFSKKKSADSIKNCKYLEEVDSKSYESHSFFTTQLGVFMAKVEKRLGLAPSDKVLFPRYNFGSFSIGSRFGNAVKEFNKNKSYDQLFTDKHLFQLYVYEVAFLENMERFYPNGVKSNVLIKLFEEIDYNVSTKYLTEQVEIFESNKFKQEQRQTKGAKDRNVAGESDNEVCY